MKTTSLFIAVFLAPALLVSAQTAPAKDAKPAVKKAAAKPAAKPAAKTSAAPAAKPAAKPAAAPAAEKPAPKAAPAAAAQPAQPAAAKPADPFEEALSKLKSKDPAERRQGADYIGQSRNAKGTAALLAALSDDSAGVRQAAADALGMLNCREASPKLADMLLKDQDPSVRQQAAISLSYIMDQASGPALVKALKDAQPAVRYAALHTLGVIGYTAAEGDIIPLVSAEDANMRRGAIAALGLFQSRKAAGAIEDALKDSDQYARLEAVRALGSIGDQAAAPALVKLLDKAEQPPVRVEAALALSKMGRNDGLMTSYEFIKSPEISLRSQALNVIAAVGDARSLQFIEEAYKAETDPGKKGMLDFTRQRLALKLKTQPK